MTLHFVAVFTALFAATAVAVAAESGSSPGGLRWVDVRGLQVEGRGWNETKEFYDRLPAKAEAMVRPAVWKLSRNSAGMHVRFATDATSIRARWVLDSASLSMPHMAALASSGLDLYVKRPDGQWRWLAVGIPRGQTNSVSLVTNLPPGKREFLLYLPLYNGVQSLELGVPGEATLGSADAWGAGTRKPIVFYGTSILQGACASRPGMVHSAILGRRFHFPTINLGFSGNGRMEPEMAALVAELNPSVFVLDCLPNMGAAEIEERFERFVLTLRRAHPKTPIVIVEDRTYADAFLVASRRQRNETSRAALRSAYARLLKAGVKGLHYIEGESLLGTDGEATADGSHPTDLGYMRQADRLERTLKPLLKRSLRD